MKILISVILSLLIAMFVFTGCEDMLDVDSDSTVDPYGDNLNTADDNTYTMSAILSQVQKLGERYVLLGELRGDLMDPTANANIYLKQISDFEVTLDNPYTNVRDYYALINNCNYVITNLDTTILSEGERVLKRSYAATKAFRAWGYMQIASIYGTAAWFEKPLLNLSDSIAVKANPELTMEELANLLIADLEPLVNTPFPSFFPYNYFSVRFLLGELYLYTGRYEKAARQYCDYINKNIFSDNSGVSVLLFKDYFRWIVSKGDFTDMYEGYYTTNNYLTQIFTSNEYGQGSQLNDYARHTSNGGQYLIKPSQVAIDNWDTEKYYDKDSVTFTFGDLRGLATSYFQTIDYWEDFNGKSVPGFDSYISKFFNRYTVSGNSQIENIYMVTPALVYLRYAEAVNRLGKPNLAFAVLKYGLNSKTLMNNQFVPANEKPSPLPDYMNFSNPLFLENIGIHAHGCGYPQNAADFSIPLIGDSIEAVEDLIVKELALEMAFEGNRFADLIRIAKRRNQPLYLANKVAEKHTDKKEAIRAKLSDEKNWYLPKK